MPKAFLKKAACDVTKNAATSFTRSYAGESAKRIVRRKDSHPFVIRPIKLDSIKFVDSWLNEKKDWNIRDENLDNLLRPVENISFTLIKNGALYCILPPVVGAATFVTFGPAAAVIAYKFVNGAVIVNGTKETILALRPDTETIIRAKVDDPSGASRMNLTYAKDELANSNETEAGGNSHDKTK